MAVSDELGMVTAPLPVVRSKEVRILLGSVVDKLCELKPSLVLIGLPTGLGGKDSPQTKRVRVFMDNLILELEHRVIKGEISSIPTMKTWDESYTSKQAEKGKSKKFKHQKSDSEAARFLLQEFLDSPDGYVQFFEKEKY